MKQWLRIGPLVAVCGFLIAGQALAQSGVVINEVLYDDASTDDEEFVELKGPGGLSLDGYTLVGVNGSGGAVYRTVDLAGQTIPADGYFVVGMTGVLNVDLVDDATWQNGPDEVELRSNDVVVDAVCYGTSSDFTTCEGTPAEDVASASLARCPDGQDTDDNSADFYGDTTPTPGTENDAPCEILPTDRTLCEVAADDVDGLPALLGELVHVSGTVIMPSGILSATTQQFAITDGECCMTVFGGAIDPFVVVGDEVDVVGTVSFFNGLTEISGPGLVVTIIGTGVVPAPIELTTFEFSVNGEDYESCFIGFHCVEAVGGDPWPVTGNANIDVDDGSGIAVMRIDGDTDIPGSPAPTAKFSFVGIGGQFDSTIPHSDGFQVFPRSLADFVFDDPDCGPPPEGACCFPEDGSCVLATGDECEAMGGVYQGDGTSCDPNPCPQPRAACCFMDGSCSMETSVDCDAAGGMWLGIGTVCDPNPCPTATHETSWGKIKNDFRSHN